MTAHRTVRLVLSLLAGLLLAGTVATTAQAEDGYRFWGYYQWSNGQWAFSQKGSDAVVPADGGVEGWRYAVGGAKPRVPRAAGDFEAICGKTPAETGKKRVALVVDPGTPEDAASGEHSGPGHRHLCGHGHEGDRRQDPGGGRAGPDREGPDLRHRGLPGQGLRRPGQEHQGPGHRHPGDAADRCRRRLDRSSRHPPRPPTTE